LEIKFNTVGRLSPFLGEKNVELKTLSYYRVKHGFYKGYYAWDLACQWFVINNDAFFQVYGFNFVPRGTLFDEAKEFVHNSQYSISGGFIVGG
jgi:triacylglycerol esterase/lipase EstA (alpha/beta hydrolase family)